MSSSLPPAGWYPDPEGSFRQRWWSGSNWTNDFAQYRPTQIQPTAPDIMAQLRQGPAQTQAPNAPAVEYVAQPFAQYVEPSAQADAYRATPQTPPQLPSATHGTAGVATLTRQPATATHTMVGQSMLGQSTIEQARIEQTLAPGVDVRLPAVATTVPAVAIVPLTPSPSIGTLAVNPNLMSSYEPFGRQSWSRHGLRARAIVRYTAGSWFVAMVPALAVGTASAIALLLPVFATWFVYAAVVAAWLLAGFGFAAADRKSLTLDNHVHTASPVWALLTPLPYLLARSVHVTRETEKQAHWPLVVFIVSTVAAAATLVLAPGLLETILTSPIS